MYDGFHETWIICKLEENAKTLSHNYGPEIRAIFSQFENLIQRQYGFRHRVRVLWEPRINGAEQNFRSNDSASSKFFLSHFQGLTRTRRGRPGIVVFRFVTHLGRGAKPQNLGWLLQRNANFSGSRRRIPANMYRNIHLFPKIRGYSTFIRCLRDWGGGCGTKDNGSTRFCEDLCKISVILYLQIPRSSSRFFQSFSKPQESIYIIKGPKARLI